MSSARECVRAAWFASGSVMRADSHPTRPTDPSAHMLSRRRVTSSHHPIARGVEWRDLPFVGAAVLAGGAILFLGRSLTFWNDEWRSIAFDGGWSDFLRPVNEHWSTLPLLAYRGTFHIVGLDSYLPYLAQVVVLHVIAVGGAYVLMRRRLGRLAATLFAIPLLLLGSGAENLFWAFQTGFVGSVAFGVWALVAVEQRGKWSPIVSSSLLLASLMSSGIGLVFVVAVGVRTLLDQPFRRRALAVLPPSIAYLAWYAWVGHDSVGKLASPFEIGWFVVRGVAHSTAAVSGFNRLPSGVTLAGVAFVLAFVALGQAAVLRRPRPLATAGLLAIVTLYVLAGSVRAQRDFDYALISRYVYVAGFFLALALADGLEPMREHIGPGRRRTVLGRLALAFGCILVTAVGVGPLRGSRDALLGQADRTRAFVTLAREYHRDPWVDLSGYGVMPPVPLLVRIIDDHGSPTQDRFFPSVARTPPPAAWEDALLLLVGDHFRFEPASEPPSAPLAAELDHVVDAIVVRRRGCFVIKPTGPLPSASFHASDNSRFRLSSHRGERIVAVLGFKRSPAMPIVGRLRAGRPIDAVIPDIRPVASVRLRIEPASAKRPVTVCPLSGERT